MVNFDNNVIEKWWQAKDSSEAFIALMMKAVSVSETSANSRKTTRRNIPQDIFILPVVIILNLTYRI
jgi:hypothetical protein